jgi:protein-tyrosine phosphatase
METRVLSVEDAQADSPKIKEAAELIDAGALVAFPTETVYGIACRVTRDSLTRLDSIKGRDAGKRYTLHIARKTDINKYVPALSLRAEKLLSNAWPGPLTIVFELTDKDIARQSKELPSEVFENLYQDNTIGIRCPDNPVASMLLELAHNPVVAPSANISGHSPAMDAGQVLSQLSGQVDLILDGGPCKYKMSSTVAKIDRMGVTILRPGIYSRAQLDAMSQVRFLFVCTGNTCRSPIAEGIFRKTLAEKLKCEVDQLEQVGYKMLSAGTMGLSGCAPSSEAVAACAARGVDITRHTSQGLTRHLIESSDMIYCMTKAHCEHIKSLWPKAAGKCLLLAPDQEIADPIGQSQEFFNSCASVIERAVKKRIGELSL